MTSRVLKIGFVLTFVAMLALVSCNKSEVSPIAQNDDANYDAQLIIDDADVAYNDATYAGGTEDQSFSAVYEGLPEAYTLEEMDMDNAGYKRTDKRFFACLKKLNLTDTQILHVRMALKGYEACKAMDIKRHREAFAKLVIRVEAARKDYIMQLKGGKITRAQFDDLMQALRKDFHDSLKHIKASYAKTLKACYDKYMRAIKATLTDRQWKAFVDCYR
ncbi:MAG: hypothetical protein V4613_02660 [Bacteroidota bacterium]